MAEEERERKRTFDRAHEREHEAVLRALDQARARYVSAKTPAAVRAAKAAFHASRPRLEQAIVALDPGRQSSELTHEYEEILALFDGPYPEALLVAKSGDRRVADELGTAIDGRLKSARAWLDEGEDDDDDEARREAREHAARAREGVRAK